MWKTCQGIVATPMQATNMPTSMVVKATDVSAQIPTHMLAVCQSSQAQAALKDHKPIRYQLVPTHNIVLAAHCAHLREFQRRHPVQSQSAISKEKVGKVERGVQTTLPVERLAVPHLESFQHVHEYLYTKNAEVFAMSMIPTSTARPDLANEQAAHTPAAWAHRLAHTFTWEVLLRQLAHTLGTWQNMVFLGIQDDRMWHALQASYYTIRGALVLQTERGLAPDHDL